MPVRECSVESNSLVPICEITTKVPNQERRDPLIPWCFSLSNNKIWGTLSKAFDRLHQLRYRMLRSPGCHGILLIVVLSLIYPWEIHVEIDRRGEVMITVITVVPIEAFRKMLTNSFPNLKEHLWTIPQQFDQILYFIFEQSDWSMKQEVTNFLRNLSNCWGIVQRCSFKLGNELVNIFRNASFYWHDYNHC
jgi:hypothetical protein